ncbi:unnamed protein product [Lymnaea stagnalis]|uniref:Retinol dehydrogenase 13 n=1 Tax=Lymnaea stagnalis TaxID=6523 RepID=A0AAV2HS46_LYMST
MQAMADTAKLDPCSGCCTVYYCIAAVTTLGALFFFRQYVKGPAYKGKEKLNGKTVIITGANTGIGKETAKDLARRGGRIILACRDIERANQARDEIIQETDNNNVVVYKLDLASFDSIREFCKKFNETEERLDILINNAGVMMCPRMLTQDGLEMQIGVNHFGHFLLTNLLLDKLKQSAPSRIVIVSSTMHITGKINFEDINSDKYYSSVSAYAQSKLANILHMRGLMKRLVGTGVTVNSLHPGAVDTELQRHLFFSYLPIARQLTYPIRSLFFKTPVQGAQTTLYAALDPSLETVSGKYFSHCRASPPSKRALDDETAEKLWQISEEITKGEK